MQNAKANNLAKVLLALAAAAALAVALVGCGSGGQGSSSTDSSSAESSSTESSAPAGEDTTIRVGASPTPHAEILNNAVKPLVEEQGYTLEVVEYTDYVIPNTATEDGEIDANYFQHIPYLEDFNVENGTHLVDVAGVHIEPMRIYAGRTSSLDDLKEGALVAVPNDPTNEARALLLLESAGLIEIDKNAGIAATINDITDNKLKLEFKEVEAATVPNVLPDVDIAVININYALGANLPEDTILHTESANSPYVNVLVVKEGNEKTDKTKVLVDAITSQDVKDYIEKNYDGEIVAV